MTTRKLSLRAVAVIPLLLVLLLPVAVQAAPLSGRGGPGGGGCYGCGGGTAGTPLSELEEQALVDAIHEEYLALNTYSAVLAQFGSVSPFYMIARSEQAHANAVGQLFTKYGLPVPANPGLGSTPVWSGLKAACQRGVEVEIDDIALYDRLLPAVNHADMIQVFTNLRSASLNCHLPRFEACD